MWASISSRPPARWVTSGYGPGQPTISAFHAPAMTDFDRDPLALIRTGDHVRVDADAGVVTITRKNPT